MDDDMYVFGTLRPETVSMVEIRSADALAEAKKAEGARCTALLIPRPPSRTGKEACSHWTSSKATLRTADRFSRNMQKRRQAQGILQDDQGVMRLK